MPLLLIIFSIELITCSSVDKLVYTSYPCEPKTGFITTGVLNILNACNIDS